MGGDRGMEGGGGGRGPGPPPGKLQVVIYFQEEKLVRTSLEKQPPPTPVGVVWIRTRMSGLTVEFYFLSSFFACYRFNYYPF